MRYVELYLRMNLRRCLHVEINSLRLFSVAMCGLVIRKNFSVLQRLQRFVTFVYGFAFAIIIHVTLNSLLSSFSFHRCLLSSVSFLLFTCLNDIWWFRYLVLNWFDVRPMYVSCASCVFTTSRYTTSLTRHSPSRRHSSFRKTTFSTKERHYFTKKRHSSTKEIHSSYKERRSSAEKGIPLLRKKYKYFGNTSFPRKDVLFSRQRTFSV